MRCRGVGPGVFEAFEARAALADFVEHVEQVPGRARQAIETGDDEHVTGLKPTDCLGELGPVRLGARYLLAENLGPTKEAAAAKRDHVRA